MIAALIVAAGRGVRAGGDVPKQYRNLAGRPVLWRTLRAFADHSEIGAIVLVINPDDRALFHATCGADFAASVTLVDGGATRDASVRAGLEALPQGATRTLIHDAARPLVSAALISRVCDALNTHAGAAPALAVTDALWRGEGQMVAGSVARDGLWRAQTPQGFHTDAIRAAHAGFNAQAADDVEVARAHGLDVAIVEGEEENLKITTLGDFDRAGRILRAKMDIRTGNGFDVHRFCDGDHVILCGERIAHSHALLGHSDADVGMHAVTDALYGALAEGDIGQHFPPSEAKWKGAASDIFLRHACALARERGYEITHVDCTLICEMPKVGPHAQAMRTTMAAIMGLDAGAVSVKATTSEGLGFTGREEGIAAMASATLVRI